MVNGLSVSDSRSDVDAANIMLEKGKMMWFRRSSSEEYRRVEGEGDRGQHNHA